MIDHVHGAPDNQEENLDDILGRGKGDPDMASGGKWVTVNPVEPDIHWTEREALGYKPSPPQEWELGDQMADHSDEQEYTPEEM